MFNRHQERLVCGQRITVFLPLNAAGECWHVLSPKKGLRHVASRAGPTTFGADVSAVTAIAMHASKSIAFFLVLSRPRRASPAEAIGVPPLGPPFGSGLLNLGRLSSLYPGVEKVEAVETVDRALVGTRSQRPRSAL
jgi:hypothetical protein